MKYCRFYFVTWNVVGATSKRHVKRFPLTIIILKSVHVTKFNSIQINLAHVCRKYLQLNYAVSILEKISICF